MQFKNYPVLPFLGFSVLPRKNLKFTKDFLSLPNPQILGKDRDIPKITKEIPCLKLTKEIQKTKERKDRVIAQNNFFGMYHFGPNSSEDFLFFLGPRSSQSLAVKEFCFVAHEICWGFFVKFLAPTFPGNWRTEIGNSFRYFASSPEKFCEYFFFVFPWEFCVEKWRGFLVDFFWSPFPTKRSTKTPQKIRGKFGKEFGAKSGTKIRKIRGTFVLRLFWPYSFRQIFATCFADIGEKNVARFFFRSRNFLA